MNFAFTSEHDQLRADVAAFLADVSASSEVRRLMETGPGYDPGTWSRMAGDLGLLGLIVPGEYGGRGLTFVELAAALEEMGAVLLCAPYFSTAVLAVTALLESGDVAACEELLPRICAGDLIATVALSEDDGRWDPGSTTAVASLSGGAWVVDGHKSYVTDSGVAGAMVVAARDQGAVSLFLVDVSAPGVTVSELRTVDQTRKQGRVALAAAPARLLGDEGAGTEVMERVLDRGRVALAAEQVGGARRCLEMAVGHARSRVQFGRPIGSFQAIKHKCAEMLLELETARSAAYFGAWAAASGDDDLPLVAAMAQARCSEAFARIAADSIQIHGGIGFTWDHNAHLFYRRARSSQLLLGDPRYHREVVARRIGL